MKKLPVALSMIVLIALGVTILIDEKKISYSKGYKKGYKDAEDGNEILTAFTVNESKETES